MYLGNTAACRKMELFGGSVDAGATGNSAVLARYTPVDEKDLGKRNNRVDEGQVFPQISSI